MVQASRSAPSLKQRYRALFPHSYDHLDNYQHVRCLSRCNLAHHSSHHAGTLTTTDKDKDKDWIAHLCSSSNSQQQQQHGPGRGGQTRMGQGAKAATRLDVDLHNGHLDLSQEKCLLVLVFPYMSSGTLADVLRRVQHPHSHHISSSLSSGAASSSSSLKQATGGGEWRRVMKEEEVAGVIARLVAALSHAKKRNIVHRDLKAENVLVDDDGQVWLADWGLATFVEQTGTRPAQPGSEAGAKSNGKGKAKAVEEQRQWQSLDGDDTFCGTPAYLSP
ncbi:protein kinase domain containing protein [Ceraceosorus bombacis]|uniref:Protein kinase domain containing protein n=1 Tax=Ceraceosorus bombacis TaxID=401625 RepID=A0A0P1BJW9_9BASI|nr:protein kinase domain containing protein [Ceraceosorus bombacis]